MSNEPLDEIRVRVTVDADMPELLQRLKASKRQAREVVHLMRLGMQMEKMLNAKAQFGFSLQEAPTSATTSTGGDQAGGALGTTAVQPASASPGVGTPLGADFAATTGLSANYFSGQ